MDWRRPQVELQMGRIRVALEDRLRSPELSVDEAVNSCSTQLGGIAALLSDVMPKGYLHFMRRYFPLRL